MSSANTNRDEKAKFVACLDCPASSHCENLKTGLIILREALKQKHIPATLRQEFADLQKTLSQYNWHFPDGEKPCALSAHKGAVTELTERVLKLLTAARAAHP